MMPCKQEGWANVGPVAGTGLLLYVIGLRLLLFFSLFASVSFYSFLSNKFST